METTDLLLVGIEVSVAFAGFAGIIATFQFDREKQVKRGDVIGLAMIVHLSLSCAFCSSLPLLLSTFNIDATTIWAVCSAYAAVYTVYVMLSINRNLRGAVNKMSVRLLFGSFYAGGGCVVLVLLLNTVDLVFHREPGPYMAGIAFALGLVGYMFARLLLHPLWVAVSEQEAANLSGTKTA